jgi:hypothetical protein
MAITSKFKIPIEYERDDEPPKLVHASPKPPVRIDSPKPASQSQIKYVSASVDTPQADTVKPAEPVKFSIAPRDSPKPAVVASEALQPKPILVPMPAPSHYSSPPKQEPEKTPEPAAQSPATPASPVKVEPVPVSRDPKVVLHDDERLLALISRDPHSIASHSDPVKHCAQIAQHAALLDSNGLYLKAYVLYEHCHKVMAAAIRIERNEEKLDKLDDLDGEYRRHMLAMDRKIKGIGPVAVAAASTKETVSATPQLPSVEQPFRGLTPKPQESEESESAHSDTENNSETDSADLVACFSCGKMVTPKPSHSIPSWLACCCPARMLCPECGEVLDSGDQVEEEDEDDGEASENESEQEEEDNEEDEQNDGTEEEADQSDQEQSDNEDAQSTVSSQNQTASDNQSDASSQAGSELPEELCPACDKQVTPVQQNSKSGFVAAICPCLNKVTNHCPECDYNLTDMTPAEGEDDDEQEESAVEEEDDEEAHSEEGEEEDEE